MVSLETVVTSVVFVPVVLVVLVVLVALVGEVVGVVSTVVVEVGAVTVVAASDTEVAGVVVFTVDAGFATTFFASTFLTVVFTGVFITTGVLAVVFAVGFDATFTVDFGGNILISAADAVAGATSADTAIIAVNVIFFIGTYSSQEPFLAIRAIW